MFSNECIVSCNVDGIYSPSDNTITENVYNNLKEEESFGVGNFETYEIFADRLVDRL